MLQKPLCAQGHVEDWVTDCVVISIGKRVDVFWRVSTRNTASSPDKARPNGRIISTQNFTTLFRMACMFFKLPILLQDVWFWDFRSLNRVMFALVGILFPVCSIDRVPILHQLNFSENNNVFSLARNNHDDGVMMTPKGLFLSLVSLAHVFQNHNSQLISHNIGCGNRKLF